MTRTEKAFVNARAALEQEALNPTMTAGLFHKVIIPPASSSALAAAAQSPHDDPRGDITTAGGGPDEVAPSASSPCVETSAGDLMMRKAARDRNDVELMGFRMIMRGIDPCLAQYILRSAAASLATVSPITGWLSEGCDQQAKELDTQRI
eukprot:scaffold196972_cov21-Prasinocladus_malaysianus.AAC.2